MRGGSRGGGGLAGKGRVRGIGQRWIMPRESAEKRKMADSDSWLLIPAAGLSSSSFTSPHGSIARAWTPLPWAFIVQSLSPVRAFHMMTLVSALPEIRMSRSLLRR